MYVYLILFQDGSFQVSLQTPSPDWYQAGARFFEVDYDFTIEDISTLSAYQYKINQLPKNLQEKIEEKHWVKS